MAEAAGRPPVVFLGVPMAINVRDVLRSGVLGRILDAGVEVHLFANAAGDARFAEEFRHPQVTIHPLVDPEAPRFIREDERILKLHLLVLSLRAETAEIMTRDSRRRQPLLSLGRAALGLAGPVAERALLRWCRRRRAVLTPDLYGELFERHRPDLVVGTRVLTMTSPRAPSNPRYLDRHLVVEAARRGVRTACLVASWDNLSTAGFFPVEMDAVAVWSPEMKEQCLRIHDLPPERVFVTGAPQHDAYCRESVLDRDAFWAAEGLDPARPVVVYATGTENLIPNEPGLVAGLLDRLPERIQLFLRLHQLDDPARYAHLRSGGRVHIDQAGKPPVGAFPDRDFDDEALARLVDTLRHADVVVNVASSISLDAAAVDTPVVVLDYDADDGVPYTRSARRFYDFTHQKPVMASGGVWRAGSADAAVDGIESYLRDPTRDAEARRRMIARLCSPIDGRAAERAADVVLDQLEVACGERWRRPRSPRAGERDVAGPGAEG